MQDGPQISPVHKQVTRDVVEKLPKVVLHDHINAGESSAPAEVEAAALAAAEELAADNVVYAELRYHPSDEAGLNAAIRGLKSAAGIDARLIVTPMRSQKNVLEMAKMTVDKFGDRVVGFDLAGEEVPGSLKQHSEALALLRENYIPTTLHAGAHEGIESIKEAVDLGAVRLGHGARMYDDFHVELEGITTGQVSSWVRDRHIVLEISPSLEVQMGVVDEFRDHPITLLQQMGFTCTINPGQSSVTSMSDELMRMAETFSYGLDEFFDLTSTAVNNAFIPQEERQNLLETTILPVYEEMAGEFNEDAAFADLHASHQEGED